MKTSSDRILTTHVGSLPRPEPLLELLEAQDQGRAFDGAQLRSETRRAVRNIPADRLRMHICWGNRPGPHTHDIAVSKIVDIVMKAKPQAVPFEGAASSHAREHEDWSAALGLLQRLLARPRRQA